MGSFVLWQSTQRAAQHNGLEPVAGGGGILAGAQAASKLLEHNECFFNRHPADLPFSLPTGFKKKRNHGNVAAAITSED